jgi:hypothetical protein
VRSCSGSRVDQVDDGGLRADARDQAARIRELSDQGHTLAAALRILALEDDLAAETGATCLQYGA